MRFSDRIEVIFHVPALRHHDLSDFGRPVTAPLGIRGESQAQVQQAYLDVQDMMVRFFKGTRALGTARTWQHGCASGRRPARSASPPTRGPRQAPTTEATLVSLSAQTAASWTRRGGRIPTRPCSVPTTSAGLSLKRWPRSSSRLPESIADFARRVYPDSVPLLDASSEAREGRGDRAGAADLAARCAASPAGDDWRVSAAIARCRDRLARLRPSR